MPYSGATMSAPPPSTTMAWTRAWGSCWGARAGWRSRLRTSASATGGHDNASTDNNDSTTTAKPVRRW